MKYIVHDLGYKTISEAIVSEVGFEFDVKNLNLENEINKKELKNINTLWDEKKFADINLPQVIFQLNEVEKKLFSLNDEIRILDMPIKFPGTNYRVPKELEYFESLIKKVAVHEHLINAEVEDYYCYITLDKKVVKKGKTTRKEGIHVDGFQGARLPEKIKNRSLLFSL